MSSKFFETALNALKKANKTRKVVLAERAGYETVEKYQSFLESSILKGGETYKVKSESPKSKVRTKVEETPKEEIKGGETSEMVIAFDTTGSMSSYIKNVKDHAIELVPNLLKANPNLKISVVAFGDYCDMKSSTDFGKAYQVLPLTNDEKEIIAFIRDAKNTHGGDGDEFYELVIKKINTETNWTEGSNKSVLLIGDADPHEVGYSYYPYVTNSRIDWKKEAKQAENLGIAYDTLMINKTKYWYKELSNITKGVNLDFKTSSKTGQLVEAAVLARGGTATMDAFMSKSMSAEVTSDVELNSVYAMYKTILK